MIRRSEAGPSGPCAAVRGHWQRACTGGLLLAGFFVVPADAQELPDLQRELREMRQHYDAELKRLRRDYEARIERLEKQVKAAEAAGTMHNALPRLWRQQRHRARPRRPQRPLQMPVSSNLRRPSCRHLPPLHRVA